MIPLTYKLPCILAAISLVHASSTIKGIGPEKYDLYNPSSDNTWTCLDGSKTIPYSAINDDYCDCADGSDEPGTSACPNSYFYCANVGHIPSYIKSFQVNDGVCDEACCDGSDENGDLIKCPNRCQEVGKAYRELQSHLKRSTEAGLLAKQKLINQAESQVAAWEEQQSILEDEIILKKSSLLQLERELKALESSSENNKKKKKSCQSGAMEVATLKHDIVILKKELNVLKTILGDMKRDHNHNFHDMAVKSAISGYDEFVTRWASLEPSIDDNLEHIDIQEPETVEEEEEQEEEEEEDIPENEGKHSVVNIVLDKLDSVLPSALKNGILDKLLSKNVSPKAKPGMNKEAALENARKLVRETESEVNKLNSDLDKIKNELAFDYGMNKEWLKLKDECIEKNEGEYTYSLCFLGDAYQKSNKDGTRTHLGKFDKFDGPENNIYKVHNHVHGTRCWNGPERSVKATIECGLNNEILEVSEPEKCEYHYRMTSPAVCQSMDEAEEINTSSHHQDNNKSKKPIHEEL